MGHLVKKEVGIMAVAPSVRQRYKRLLGYGGVPDKLLRIPGSHQENVRTAVMPSAGKPVQKRYQRLQGHGGSPGKLLRIHGSHQGYQSCGKDRPKVWWIQQKLLMLPTC